MPILKLEPVLKDFIWGGKKLKKLFNRKSDSNIAESWELSVHNAGESVIQNGEFQGKTLTAYIKSNPDCLGEITELPILIKYLDANSNLSVQVHPDDNYSRKYENDNGKTEMWYVISAEKNSGIYCGLNKDITKDEFVNLINQNEIESVLNFIPVRAGDCYLIEAGTLHAICKGVVICEVQQSSNVTYRVYDYGRVGADGKPRQLHIEKAIEVSKLTKFADNTKTENFKKFDGGKIRLLTKCKYFKCYEVLCQEKYSFKNNSSFSAINIIKGDGIINKIKFTSGDTFFVPCGEKVVIEGKAKIVLSAQNN